MRDGQWVIVTPSGIVMRSTARWHPDDAQHVYAWLRGLAWSELEAQGYACKQYRRPHRRTRPTTPTAGDGARREP